MSIPRLLVAGTHSGVGKTSVTVGLCRAWRAMGLKVAVFKCGPDYLDPTYHSRAAERVCHNLDGWMMGREAVLQTFARVSANADIALIEGVMGLYDGATPTGEAGSSAEIAKWLDAPVLLVCDAGGMARSVAALARGFAGLDPQVRLLGLWCNRVGSESHLQLLAQACSHAGTAPVLGGFPKNAAWAFPERHLGLRTAERHAVPESVFAQLGEAVAEHWGHALQTLPRGAPLPQIGTPETPETPTPCRIGVAQDSAFHFYYEDNLARLRALGAELVPFSPLHDSALPAVSGLYIGGGYPELHAATLAANTPMRAAIAQFTGPIYAECGGLMYLTRALQTTEGTTHPMVGRIRATAVMHPKLQALGYVEVETQADSPLGRAGLRFRGHQFRYSELQWDSEPEQVYRIRKRRGGQTHSEGYTHGQLLASYVHAHWASNPEVARGFVQSCAAHGL